MNNIYDLNLNIRQTILNRFKVVFFQTKRCFDFRLIRINYKYNKKDKYIEFIDNNYNILIILIDKSFVIDIICKQNNLLFDVF